MMRFSARADLREKEGKLSSLEEKSQCKDNTHKTRNGGQAHGAMNKNSDKLGHCIASRRRMVSFVQERENVAGRVTEAVCSWMNVESRIVGQEVQELKPRPCNEYN